MEAMLAAETGRRGAVQRVRVASGVALALVCVRRCGAALHHEGTAGAMQGDGATRPGMFLRWLDAVTQAALALALPWDPASP